MKTAYHGAFLAIGPFLKTLPRNLMEIKNGFTTTLPNGVMPLLSVDEHTNQDPCVAFLCLTDTISLSLETQTIKCNFFFFFCTLITIFYREASPIAELVANLDEALELASTKVKEDGRIFLLGGEQIYKQGILRPECSHVLITNIHSSKHIECDTFIPKIDPDIFRQATHDELEEFLKENIPKGHQIYEHFTYEFVLHIRK